MRLGGCGLHISLHVYKDSLSLNIVSLSGHHGSQYTMFYLYYENPSHSDALVTL